MGLALNWKPIKLIVGGIIAIAIVIVVFIPSLWSSTPSPPQIHTQGFAKVEAPPAQAAIQKIEHKITTVAAQTKVDPPPPRNPTPCQLCSEPAQRYIASLMAPFPTNRQTYEIPRMAPSVPLGAFSGSSAVPQLHYLQPVR